MATKPTQNPEWATNDDPVNIIEPTTPMKTTGIVQGGIWGREHLNWMFNTLGKWANWVRDYALDKDNNLSDVGNTATAFNNIKQVATTTTTGVVEKATAAEVTAGTVDKFPDSADVKGIYLSKSDNLSTVANATTAFNNIKQVATTTTTGVVEKATNAEVTAGTVDKFPDSADVKGIYLGKSDNLSTVANATTAFNNIKQEATTTTTGVVEKATAAEVTAGTVDKYADTLGIKGAYVQGQEGTASDEFSNNLTNGQTFVAKTDIVNDLNTPASTGGKVLDARQGKILNDHFGTGGSQVQTNTLNDARFLLEDNNLSDLVNVQAARSNLGIVFGTIAISGDGNQVIDLGATVHSAMVCLSNNNINNVDPLSVTWTGNTIRVNNSFSSTLTAVYWVFVGGTV